ncbi:DUF1302 family protein [Desulfoluna spongiiphila]|uniref:DUF1302 family protein n=1 Tax=Desulfoluna spongiiphila TaxID=419481 RepID=UPI001259E9F9|nr:DUF1302 family protein [Desulfoluna spongiiphila]VVS94932.1 hypothetical protein DBB_45090 [Desulfoluna spongiiphila]
MRCRVVVCVVLVWAVCVGWVFPVCAWLPDDVEAEWTIGAKSMAPMKNTEYVEDSMISNEVRVEGALFWACEGFSVYATPELRINDAVSSDSPGGEIRYSDSGTTLRRNLTLSSRGAELSFRELYVEKETDTSRWRVGNQVFAWGTADFINPTSYFNPEDLRELFLKEEDALLQGVPAVSMLRFIGDYSVEAVLMPVGVARLNAWEGDYFYIEPDNFSLPVKHTENEEPDVRIENAGVGMKAARSVGSCDLSVSAYHGPDREPLMTPDRVTIAPGEPVTVVARSFHGDVTSVGADVSADLGQCVVQVEGAWSFDKQGYVTQDTSDPSAIVFPYEIVDSDFWSVSAGLNWFLPVVDWFPAHEGESVMTVEAHRSGYTRSGLGDPFYDETLAFRYQDSFFGSHVPVSLFWVMDGEAEGQMTWAKVGYDFQNGLLVEGSLVFYDGSAPDLNEVGSPFWYLRDRDLFMVTVDYQF